MEPPTLITLLSKEEETFQIPLNVALMSETLKALMTYPEDEDDREDWEPTGDGLPLPPVPSAVLTKVIEFCTYHCDNKDTLEEERNAWDKKFVAIDDEVLFALILAANYLDIKPLLDVACQAVAEYIKACKTPQEIRRRFNIVNDFTPEEEEEVRKENAWCEER